MAPQFSGRKSLRYPKLMIPGPVDVQESVIVAMAKGVMPHYGAEWTGLYKETTNLLKTVFQTEGDVFLLVGSGTCGLESAISSMFCPGEKVIIVNNGFFGDRLLQLARAHNIQYLEAVAEWGRPIDSGVVERLLAEDRSITGMVAVHHETSTGVLNPVQDLGNLARRFGIPLVIDAVSSLGGEELKMDEWGIDVCVAGSNKSLESVPGVSPVAVNPIGWKRMAGKQFDAPGWYLNLRLWKQYLEEWGDWHPAPVTIATPVVTALNAALEELVSEGLENRITRYKEIAVYFRQSIEKLGFRLYISNEHASSCISSVCRLPNMEVSSLISYLLEEKNIQIAGGLGQTKGEIFRVAIWEKPVPGNVLTC
ncbi:MAG: alanine--glyoxylate aminotransferase family protein [Chloroflexi bacterium]|nr:alanine--glyoxylate aminotransferase family protein [Chloroflexota bacterium]